MPPSLPSHTDILIVGAGPSGLAAALSLHKHGCTDITIVDSAVAGESTSRALAVHAATLEVGTQSVILAMCCLLKRVARLSTNSDAPIP
jgi:glycine/D-amino acid oxidase-like deaminating enzyme